MHVNGQLTAEDVTELKRQPMVPIVVPTYIPDGMRVARVQTYREKLRDGSDDLEYQIHYRGTDGTCLFVGTTQSGSSGLQEINRVSTSLGTVKIHQEPRIGRNLVAFIPIRGNTMFRTPAYGDGCRDMNPAQFFRVIQSIRVLD